MHTNGNLILILLWMNSPVAKAFLASFVSLLIVVSLVKFSNPNAAVNVFTASGKHGISLSVLCSANLGIS